MRNTETRKGKAVIYATISILGIIAVVGMVEFVAWLTGVIK